VNKTGAGSASGVSNLKIQTKKESAMRTLRILNPTFYKITDGIPIPNKKGSRWSFTDELKIGDSMAVKSYGEAAAIRYRMRKNNKDITCKAFKYDNEDGFVRIWRTK